MFASEIDPNSQQLVEQAQRLTNDGKQPAEILEALLGIYSEEPPRVCRVCGCSDNDACLPPCWWVDDDLCSNPQCVRTDAQQNITLRLVLTSPQEVAGVSRV